MGALFVFETLSVIVQVGSFRLIGRRVFRMPPVHHHFELGGWPETTVIIRFWILAIMSTAVALGLYSADSSRPAHPGLSVRPLTVPHRPAVVGESGEMHGRREHA